MAWWQALRHGRRQGVTRELQLQNARESRARSTRTGARANSQDRSPLGDDRRMQHVFGSPWSRALRLQPRLPNSSGLDQLQSLRTGVPVLSDDDVVVHRNPQRLRDLDNHAHHFNVGVRRCRVSSGMVAHEDDRDCAPGRRRCPLPRYLVTSKSRNP